ncbi:MAG: hypothetical protein IKE69_04335 [Thermoguttaceae bacterium]|nr:hypothetical protein [Thermoguttaceae bacterium]
MSAPNTSFRIPAPVVFEKLVDFEHEDIKEHAGVSGGDASIAYWEYCALLLDFKAADTITDRAKKVLKELYFTDTPTIFDDIKIALGEKDKIVVQGSRGLGGFAHQFYDGLTKKFPGHAFTVPANVYSCLFLDFIKMDDEQLYVVLRSRFRAALATVFGDSVIKTW